MGFVQSAFRPEGRLKSPEQVAREVHEVSLARGLDELATVLALMCIAQESNFWCPANKADPTSFNYSHDSESDDGRSVGYLQQQNKVPGENPTGPGENWWGTMASRMDLKRSANEFLDRLSDDYHQAEGNPRAAGDFIQRVQRSAYPRAYDKHWDVAWDLVHRLGAVQPVPPPPPPPARPPTALVKRDPGWRGDPVFLPDLLKAWGVDVQEYPGWRERGHGDFGQIWGVVAHHTGSFGETPKGIAEHPTLGLASQLYLGRNGEVVVCGAGVAWHAGSGDWPGIPTNGANQVTIGIEAANDGGGVPGKPHRSSWSNQQYESYTTVVAAILWFLGHNSDRLIAHKEWAGRAQGKWDPGAIDMGIMRTDVQRKIDAGPPIGEGEDDMFTEEDRMLLRQVAEIRRKSKSPVRPLDDSYEDTCAGYAWMADAHGHFTTTYIAAQIGHQPSLDRLRHLAEGVGDNRYPDRQDDCKLAQQMLSYIENQQVAPPAVADSDTQAG